MEVKHTHGLTAYPDALAFMEQRVADIQSGQSEECIWLVEHPPLYTGGTSAKSQDLLDANQFPVYDTGRGGEYTYHGPGQRITYCMLDLKRLFAPEKPDLKRYVWMLEQAIIDTLESFDIQGERREGRIGIWVTDTPSGEAKIAAIGIRVRKWVSFHGLALNIHPDLSHFGGIVPCGISDFGVTSMHALGKTVSMEAVDQVLVDKLKEQFAI